jgi:hypothetical protein
MLGDSKQATAATTSLIYLTLGSLLDVWMVVYYFYLRNHGGSDIAYLYVSGFFATGVVLILIGLAVGRIGAATRAAEVAPTPTSQVVTAAPVGAGVVTQAPVLAQAAPVAPGSPALASADAQAAVSVPEPIA